MMPGRHYEPNPAVRAATSFVDALARAGLRDVCVAPGSRSTPLALAFYANQQVRIHTHLDERSAAFFALGLSLHHNRPAALLCTSGTAGANFYPAIIEALMSQVPLLVLTADRPPELRHSGANQTIDQIKMFGDNILWSVDVALPQDDAPEVVERYLQTLAARALAVAGGLRSGPVHLNFPFRKPLEPMADSWPPSQTAAEAPSHTRISHGLLIPTPSQVDALVDLLVRHPRGIIVCGPQREDVAFAEEISRLARRCGYPILADPLSGLRFGTHVQASPVCGAYETFLAAVEGLPPAELVLRFGAVPTSKRLSGYLASLDSAEHIHVRANGVWSDDNYRTTTFLQADATATCVALNSNVPERKDLAWQNRWLAVERRSWVAMTQALQEAEFDGAYVSELMDSLADGDLLFCGNSLPIRHVDQFGRPSERNLRIVANRGASGIDGNISTGLGLARASDRPTTILVGDITFYHDSNGLLALRNMAEIPVTLVVLNNGGGGIFQRLPVAGFEPPFRELFQTPHDLNIAGICAAYGLSHITCHTPEQFRRQLRLSREQRATVVEIVTDAKRDNQLRLDLEAQLRSVG